MKILELRFKNLNSLYGEWLVDFTNPDYISNGIFALIGPTGAGKSTILDAICLALYGATPRLGKITKSGNEVMSRQTGECYAEVVFESRFGRFRCHWEQRRARKKAQGKLQEQEHQIADADTGKLIETRKRLVIGVIEEKTGMDFERFTRSILLAQGGFDTFLKADIEQKSRILEQITGTEIYSEISRQVHERQREEREKLNILNAKISGIAILDPKQEKEIQAELALRQEQEIKLADNFRQTGKAKTWLAGIAGLHKEINDLAEQTEELHSKMEAFRPQRQRLEWAVKAASLDGDYATLRGIRQQLAQEKKELDNELATLPELEYSVKIQEKALIGAEQRTLESKKNLQAEAPLIQKIFLLDQNIARQSDMLSQSIIACQHEAASIETDKQARLEEQKKRILAESMLETVKVYLKENAQDEWLIAGLAGIKEQFGYLLNKQDEITQKKKAFMQAENLLNDSERKLHSVSIQSAVSKKALSSAEKQLQQGRDKLNKLLQNKLLREYRAEKETLLKEKAYLARIAALEHHREKLEDGKPCPLCGATEHPFAVGQLPKADKMDQKIDFLTQLIRQAENLEEAIKQMEQAANTARFTLNDNERQEADATNDKKAAVKTLEELTQTLGKLESEFVQIKQAVLQKLQPLGITEIAEGEVGDVLELLESRLEQWHQQLKKQADIEKQIAWIDSRAGSLDAVIKEKIKALSEKQLKQEQLKKELDLMSTQRKQLYGNKQPEEEQKQLNRLVDNAEKSEKQIRDQNAELQQKLNMAKTRIDTLNKRIASEEQALKEAESNFIEALNLAGFIDEKSFIQARVSVKERELLTRQAEELDTASTALQARQKDRKARLAEEEAKKLTYKTLEEVDLQSKEMEDTLEALRDTITSLKLKLSENASAEARIKAKQQAIQAQQKECRRWENLHMLIGSADGKKYRNFAQGLTFELMITHANRQLQKMTDRYLLIRDEQQPLVLNVIDNYQAGEIRSTKNLSGGESFIVSLSLALGLSKMASRKVQVDSMFLDEGFGTLDEETLETALETLSNLQQNGKLIGVISHVPALKERISTQITITPVSGGRSLLNGPGCKALAG